MRQGRFIAVGLAALFALGAGAAPAVAATDNNAADFEAGTQDKTVVDPAGSVQIARVPVSGPFTVSESQQLLPGTFAPTADAAGGARVPGGVRAVDAPRP